jgi:hypothetical protein
MVAPHKGGRDQAAVNANCPSHPPAIAKSASAALGELLSLRDSAPVSPGEVTLRDHDPFLRTPFRVGETCPQECQYGSLFRLQVSKGATQLTLDSRFDFQNQISIQIGAQLY